MKVNLLGVEFLGHDVGRILQFLRRASVKQSRQWKVLFSNKDLVNRGYSLSMGEESSLKETTSKGDTAKYTPNSFLTNESGCNQCFFYVTGTVPQILLSW